MPQLDKVTFLSQVFWLTVTFLSLYIISIFWILPTISFNLFARRYLVGHDPKERKRNRHYLIFDKASIKRVLKYIEKVQSHLVENLVDTTKIMKSSVPNTKPLLLKELAILNQNVVIPSEELLRKTYGERYNSSYYWAQYVMASTNDKLYNYYL